MMMVGMASTRWSTAIIWPSLFLFKARVVQLPITPLLWRNLFLSAPNAGDLTEQDEDFNFPYETNPFFLLDAIDVVAPADTRVLVGAGSSSVDGSITTPDNNDRFLTGCRVACTPPMAITCPWSMKVGGDTAAVPPPCSLFGRCYRNGLVVMFWEYLESPMSFSMLGPTTLAMEFRQTRV
jgi:hypothetical protein